MRKIISDKSIVLPAQSPGIKNGAPSPGKNKTMPRLKGFNYRRPFFYMVTLKRLANLAAFLQISDDAEPPKDAKGRPRYLIANEITRAFAREIREFASHWRGLAPIECFIVMPDHIHLLIKLKIRAISCRSFRTSTSSSIRVSFPLPTTARS